MNEQLKVKVKFKSTADFTDFVNLIARRVSFVRVSIRTRFSRGCKVADWERLWIDMPEYTQNNILPIFTLVLAGM